MMPQTKLTCEENPHDPANPCHATQARSQTRISRRSRPHFLRVAVRGEASFDQAEVLAAQLLRAPLDGARLVVLDLAELTFLSSLATGALASYRRGVGRRGVEVRLANVQARSGWRWNRPGWGSCSSGSIWRSRPRRRPARCRSRRLKEVAVRGTAKGRATTVGRVRVWGSLPHRGRAARERAAPK